MEYKIDEDEVILYKGNVKYAVNSKKVESRFTLTSKKLIFEAKKKDELLNVILLEEIKIYKNKVCCRQNFKEIQIQSKKNDFSILFSNIIDATKVWNYIVDNITGTHILIRGLDKAREGLELVDEASDIAYEAKGTIIRGLLGKKKKK